MQGNLVVQFHCKHCSEENQIELFDSEQAADICGGPNGAIAVQTLNRWRRHGWVQFVGPFGNSYFYTREQLNQGLRNKKLFNRIEGEDLGQQQ
jgi:hypothetical protein